MLGTFLLFIAATLAAGAAWIPWWGLASLAEERPRPLPLRRGGS